MEPQGIAWAGTRTERFDETVEFFEQRLGLRRDHEEEGMVAFKLPDGGVVEVFSADDPDHQHFTTGPVVGFKVNDVEAAYRELEAAGVEMIGSIERGGGMAWAHFRAPDGNLWEITGDDR